MNKPVTHLKTPIDDFHPYLVLIPFKDNGFQLKNYFGLDSQFNELEDTFLDKEQINLIDNFGKKLFKLYKNHKKNINSFFSKFNKKKLYKKEETFQHDIYNLMLKLDEQFQTSELFYTFRWIVVQRNKEKNRIEQDRYLGISLNAQGREKLLSLTNDFLKNDYSGFKVF